MNLPTVARNAGVTPVGHRGNLMTLKQKTTENIILNFNGVKKLANNLDHVRNLLLPSLDWWESLYLIHRFLPLQSQADWTMQAISIIIARHSKFVSYRILLKCRVHVDFDKYDIPLTKLKLNNMVVCRYSSVISSHYLSGQDILRISSSMLGPQKCRIKVLPMGQSGHFTSCTQGPKDAAKTRITGPLFSTTPDSTMTYIS